MKVLHQASASNKTFYVLVAGTQTQYRPHRIPARVFVFNLLLENRNIFELESHEDAIEIGSAAIKKKTLFCGMSYLRQYIQGDPKIKVMNILTGKIEEEHILKYTRSS